MQNVPLSLLLVALTSAGTASAQSGTPKNTSGQNVSAPRAPEALPADSFALARRYTNWFYTGNLDSLVAHHSAEGLKDAGLKARLGQSFDELTQHAGREVSVIEERFITRNGRRQYWRTAGWARSRTRRRSTRRHRPSGSPAEEKQAGRAPSSAPAS